MIKVLKNVSPVDVFIADTGVVLVSSIDYQIPEQDYLLWAASSDVLPYIASGDIVVNNGTDDLSPSDGARFLEYPDRITVQSNSVDTAKVVTTLNFAGSISAINDGNGKVTISSADSMSRLREVTLIYMGPVAININSCLLYEQDPLNGNVSFLLEETI